jgi:hypothetical protein
MQQRLTSSEDSSNEAESEVGSAMYFVCAEAEVYVVFYKTTEGAGLGEARRSWLYKPNAYRLSCDMLHVIMIAANVPRLGYFRKKKLNITILICSP